MPRNTTVLIFAGEDHAELADLRRRVGIAERKVLIAEAEVENARLAPRMVGDEVPSDDTVTQAKKAVEDAKAEYDAFVAEAADRAEVWELEAIGHDEWRAMKDRHPPRKVPAPTEADPEAAEVHEDDAEPWLVNTVTFGKELLNYRHTDEDGDEFRTVVKPDLSVDDLRRRIKRLSDGEFHDLWSTAYLLNSGGIGNPKGSTYGTTPTSSET